MRDTVLNFKTLKSAEINDPEGPEKYNNTEVRGNFLQLPHLLLQCAKFHIIHPTTPLFQNNYSY
jgi:hypothetical protein